MNKMIAHINKLKNYSSNKGSITIILLIFIIIIGSVYFVGGLGSRLDTPNLENAIPVQIDEDQEASGSARDSLQLKTIKFKPCAEIAAVNFLLDRTSSMENFTPSGKPKMEVLKDAVVSFIDSLSDNSVIGVQYFSSKGIGNLIEIQLKSDFPTYESAIRSLPADGTTPTHDGLAFSLDRLQNGLPKFPDRQFHFIFVSDGQPVPSTQDPRLFNPDPSIQIKDLGVNVYSIGILDQIQIRGGRVKDLLTHIASSPSNVYISPDGEDLDQIITQIAENICTQSDSE